MGFIFIFRLWRDASLWIRHLVYSTECVKFSKVVSMPAPTELMVKNSDLDTDRGFDAVCPID